MFSLSLNGVEESDDDFADMPDLVDSSDSNEDASAEKEDVTDFSDESGVFKTSSRSINDILKAPVWQPLEEVTENKLQETYHELPLLVEWACAEDSLLTKEYQRAAEKQCDLGFTIQTLRTQRKYRVLQNTCFIW